MGNFYKQKRGRPSERSVGLTDKDRVVIEEQLQAFREKFGRDARPGEPIYFDPTKDVPTPLSEEAVKAHTIASMRKAGVREAVIYAYEKTGWLVTARNRSKIPPGGIKEYEMAFDEWERLHGGKKA